MLCYALKISPFYGKVQNQDVNIFWCHKSTKINQNEKKHLLIITKYPMIDLVFFYDIQRQQ